MPSDTTAYSRLVICLSIRSVLALYCTKHVCICVLLLGSSDEVKRFFLFFKVKVVRIRIVPYIKSGEGRRTAPREDGWI